MMLPLLRRKTLEVTKTAALVQDLLNPWCQNVLIQVSNSLIHLNLVSVEGRQKRSS